MTASQLNLSSYQALLFDLDGTLVATEQAYINCTAQILAEHGRLYQIKSHRTFMSMDTASAAQWLVDSFKLPLTAKIFLQQRNALVLEYFSSAREVAGVSAFFAAICLLDFKLAITTSSLRVNAQHKLRGRLWSRHFNTWVCGDDEGINRRKPAPDIFLLAAQKLSVEPHQCLVFEDSPAGIAAAKAAGMAVVAVVNPDLAMLKQSDLQVCVGQIVDYRTLLARP